MFKYFVPGIDDQMLKDYDILEKAINEKKAICQELQ